MCGDEGYSAVNMFLPTWTQELVEPACMLLLLISLTVSHLPLSRTHWALVSSAQSCRLVRSPMRR